MTFFLSRSCSMRASLPTLVVLPEPCRPAIRITVGGFDTHCRVPLPAGVRELADRYGLPVADKPDSYEICFVPDNDYRGFLKRRVDGLEEDGVGRMRARGVDAVVDRVGGGAALVTGHAAGLGAEVVSEE